MKRPARTLRIGYRYTRRSAMGLEIASDNEVSHIVGKIWRVTSSSGHGSYVVNLSPIGCTCPDHQYRGVECKHIVAAALMAVGC